MKIALIDSGVDINNHDINSETIKHIKTSLYQNNKMDNIGHGTAIAFILQKHIKDCEIISFKMFDIGHITIEDEIIEILNSIYNFYNDIKLIHISSGITYLSRLSDFNKICELLNERKTYIISAYDNDGTISYPAAFNTVIGVYWNRYIKSVNEYYYVENSAVEIFGYAGNQRLPWLNGKYKYVAGSSFIAPYITAKIANILEKIPNLESDEIRNILKHDAIRVYELDQIENNATFQKKFYESVRNIHTAIIFPFNKENHALISNQDLITFKIVGVYDLFYSRNLNKFTSDILFGENIYNTLIRSFDTINWNDEQFDTIIVGHLDIINNWSQIDYIQLILNKCIEYHKNCYFYDNLSLYKDLVFKIVENGNIVYQHEATDININRFPSGSYHKLATPVLGIVGTSPRQGKYNLQLMLRRRFLNTGYEIGQMGTEPTASLLGMDVIFSNGYGNSYNVTCEQEIKYINECLFNIMDKELIMIGTQSQTIPKSFGNTGFLTTHQSNTLIAAEPDCVLLCTNYDDDINYVERTITVLKNYYLTKVIAIIVYPFKRNTEWNINNSIDTRINKMEEKKIKRLYKKRFKLPAYINGNKEDIDKLFLNCIKHFS